MNKENNIYNLIETAYNNILEGEFNIQKFCIDYELLFRDLNRNIFTEIEWLHFRKIFDVVVYYSEFPTDRNLRSGYTDENQVIKVIKEVYLELIGNNDSHIENMNS